MTFCFVYGKGERTLSLLVENCGRVNYGKALDEQRKGNLVIYHHQRCIANVCVRPEPLILKIISRPEGNHS